MPPLRKSKMEADPEAVRSVERACDILFTFISSGGPLSLLDISKKTKLPKSTTYRILRSLENKSMIQQDRQTQEYSLGFKAFQLGSVIYNQIDIRKIALPYMKELASKTGDAVSLNVVQDQSRVCIERIESRGLIRYYLPIGSRGPLYLGATGKVLLAFLPQEEIEQIIKAKVLNNPKARNVDVVKLRQELRDIREKRYVFTNDELGLGIATVAAAIIDYAGKVSCINISYPTNRFTEDKVKEYTKILLDMAQEICMLVGGKL